MVENGLVGQLDDLKHKMQVHYRCMQQLQPASQTNQITITKTIVK